MYSSYGLAQFFETKRKSWKKSPDQLKRYEMNCGECGDFFVAGRKDAKYCCDDCRDEAKSKSELRRRRQRTADRRNAKNS